MLIADSCYIRGQGICHMCAFHVAAETHVHLYLLPAPSSGCIGALMAACLSATYCVRSAIGEA